jgi:hypothetical protein
MDATGCYFISVGAACPPYGRRMLAAQIQRLNSTQHEARGADRFLAEFGLHLDLFFTWCDAEGRPAWRLGHPPAWQEEEVDAEVLVEWREEDRVTKRKRPPATNDAGKVHSDGGTAT